MCEESGGYHLLGLLEDATAVEEGWVADIAHGGWNESVFEGRWWW